MSTEFLTFSYPAIKPERPGVYTVFAVFPPEWQVDSRWVFSYWTGTSWCATSDSVFGANRNRDDDDTFLTRRQITRWAGITEEEYQRQKSLFQTA